jgi:hypothetical protein
LVLSLRIVARRSFSGAGECWPAPDLGTTLAARPSIRLPTDYRSQRKFIIHSSYQLSQSEEQVRLAQELIDGILTSCYQRRIFQRLQEPAKRHARVTHTRRSDSRAATLMHSRCTQKSRAHLCLGLVGNGKQGPYTFRSEQCI